ncbi:MAG: hypothetical protein LBQ37_02830 [Elusimicrobiota bacterium]|nr:hypothetical protein [Elusimicrobiota bacterium]
MKKVFYIFAFTFAIIFTIENLEAKELVIGERFFVTQTNYVYQNPKSYIGTEIKLEGIFDKYDSYDGKSSQYYVFRYGPGCCGNDGYVGFEVIWDKPYPKKDDWVEAQGTLEEYSVDRVKFLRLRLTSLKTLDKRGKEIVLR